ncbi:mucin-5AC-like isoform X2 [Amphibalanus amphitrite]|uniref:mucin-5AC-like isoform X2 n=1 Tax=Amphibalanus amphitrite TaxID=1232801 RepID=UPI001C90BBF0|nr:mucin-5AC-like isoform X2 [Amphibalanus amphitrite]
MPVPPPTRPAAAPPLEEPASNSDPAMEDIPLEDGDSNGRLVVVPHDEVLRLDLSELPDAEAEAILDVLGKDSVFRAEEKGRIDKIEAEVHEESERQRSLEQQQRDARRACARCGQPFRILFNKRLVCGLCSANVCRRCAAFQTGRNVWLCSVCHRERELQANKWLSEIQLRHRVSVRTPGSRLSDSEDDSGYDPSVTHDEPARHPVPTATGEQSGPAAPADPDQVTAEVRGHLENVVETLLGASIQSASIRPAATDAALYREYHPKLVAAINRLTRSLCMTLQNRPLDEACSPTTTLAELKAVIQEAQEASMRLPLPEDMGSDQVTPAEARDSLTSPDGCGEEPNSHTYEEILATAVLSRLAEKARRTAAASFCDAAVQSDDLIPPESCDVIRPVECAAVRDVTRPVGSAPPTGGRVDQSEATDGEEGLSDVTGGVLEITIEEEIEEIVTYDDGDGTASGGGGATPTGSETDGEGGSRRTSVASLASTLRSSRSSRDHSGDDLSLPGPSISYSDLTFGGGQSVPFPELGRSLTEVSPLDEGDDDESGDGTSWEENWLFRRRRLTQANRLLGEEPVPMLVPDPSQPTAVTVGARDVDELSELSERGSESSLDDWTAGPPSLSDVPPVTHQDVTSRLKAARDADRDRYLTAARINATPSGSGPTESAERPTEKRRSSTDATSLAVTTRVQPAPVSSVRPTAGVSTPESSRSRAMSWSSVPSDVDQAFSAVSERLAAGSPPPSSSSPAAGAGLESTQTDSASSAAKSTLSAAERTRQGSSERTTPSAPERTVSSAPSSAVERTVTRSEVIPPPLEVTRSREEPSRTDSVQHRLATRTAPAGVGTELMIQAGNIAQFRCRVPVTEGSETHWLREGAVLESDDRHEMYRVRDQHHLLVYGVTRRDAGRYSCLVLSGDGAETWHHFTLRVLGSARPPQQPRFSVAPEATLQPVDGAALRLAVRVVGQPEPRVTFLREERPLRHSDTVRIERHSGGEWVLVVQPIRPADSGQYSVRADSSAGAVSRPFLVEVQPPPEVPAAPLPPPSPPAVRHAVRERTTRPAASPSPVTSPSTPMTSPPSYVTSRDEALKETSLTEACNSVILRARPARVRSPADGGRDSESDGDGDGDGEICLPQPPPGTIAEREHRKWENAVAMPNNPYTLERVKQRRRSRHLDRTGYYATSHYSSGEDVSDHDLVSTDPSNKIDCGLKSINSERYRRDYYINASARGRWSSVPSASRRQGGSVAGGGVSSRPVSALSEEPLPPLSVRGSNDDLRSAGAGSVYHSTESLAVTERVSSVSPSAASGGGLSERRPSTRSSAASPAVAEEEMPPEGTVRSAVQRMQQLSRSAEELAGQRRRSTPPADAVDGRSTLSVSPSVLMTTTPPPPPVEEEPDAEEPCEQQEAEEEVRRSPLYVHVEEEEAHEPPTTQPTGDGGLEQRPSPDGRESLASPGSADPPPQLPSVKELRNHFQAGGAPPQPQKQVSPLYNASVLIIEKADQESEAWDEPRELRKVEKLRRKTSDHKVHSLTARSVSREFREGLKLGAPISLNTGNIRDPGLLSGRRPVADCGIQERQQESEEEGELEMAPGLRLVASRAAFWDRKVAQELS